MSLAMRRHEAHIYAMTTSKLTKPPESKIQQLVAAARADLKRCGIDVDGKRAEDVLRMAREERNKPRVR